MNIDQFVLDTGSAPDILKSIAKRYRLGTQRSPHDLGYIMIYAHGTGHLKELWEPIIERLFENDKGNKGPNRILEAWTIDCQNHGRSASLNDEVFLRKPDILSIHHYADALSTLCRSGLLGEVRRGIHKVVLVGHSAGSTGVVLAVALFGHPSAAPVDKIILVDPVLYPDFMGEKTTPMYKAVAKATPSRRHIWESKEAAHEWLKSRAPYKFWDPRILKLYTEYGLRPLPTPFHPNKKGVVTSCSPAHEAAAFHSTDNLSTTFTAMEHLNNICGVIPVHLIFGARNDMFTREMNDSIANPAAGRVIASVTRIRGAGHLVVQEKPDRLADAIYTDLNMNTSQTEVSKL